MPDVLGLDRHMHEAYRVLVNERQCTAAQVAAQLGIPRSDAEETLDRLATAGLAAPCGDESRRIVPLDPQETLGATLARKQAKLAAEQHELSRARDVVATLAATFSAQNGDGRAGKSDVSHGRAAVRARVEDLVAGAANSVVCVVDEGAHSIALGIQSDIVEACISRGVSVRVLYPRTTVSDPRVVAQTRWLVAAGGRARAGRDLPPSMIVVDGGTSLLPADGRAATAIVVHNRALGRSLGALFDQLWNEARAATAPPAPVEAGEPTTAEVDLLRLLGKGMTDASAARQLGVSLRTVRRMMADLMTRLGARSRFEAGMRATERGWVGPGTPIRLARGTRAQQHRLATKVS